MDAGVFCASVSFTRLSRPPSSGRSFGRLCAAPVRQELRDEGVLVARLDCQRRQRERHGERSVVAESPGCHRATERWMGVIDDAVIGGWQRKLIFGANQVLRANVELWRQRTNI